MSYSITIKFELSGDSTPLNPQDYIIADSSNPNIIEEGGNVTLKFKADGMYFSMKNRKGAAITGATGTWTCASPYLESEITLSNPTADVEITIVAVVKAAPQLVTKPFLYQMPTPVDTRLVLTKKEMLEVNDLYQPEVYFALCKDDGHFYLYNKNIKGNSETGKFTVITEVIEATVDGGEITDYSE